QPLVTGTTGQHRGTTRIREGRARSRTTPGHVARRLLLWSVSTQEGNIPEVVLHTLLAMTDMDHTCPGASSHTQVCRDLQGGREMTGRIGINGLGRVGRMVLRRTMTLPDVEVVAVNDRARLGDLAYLLKYDSVHGLFPGEVTDDGRALLVQGAAIQFSSET